MDPRVYFILVCAPTSSHMTVSNILGKDGPKNTPKSSFPLVRCHHLLLNSCSSSLPASSFTPQLITSSPPLSQDTQLYYCLAAHIALSLQPAVIRNRSLFLLGCMVTRVSVSSDIPTPANFPPHLHSTEQRQESVTADMDSDSSTQTHIRPSDAHRQRVTLARV